MRILHVGYGFRPWIVNGLVVHSENVMHGQVRQGHEVGYFFPARQLPLVRRPFVHRWRRGGVQMFELVNSDLVTGRHEGTAFPQSELDHAPSERAFVQVLRQFHPDVIHVHDLGGLPSSILELGRIQRVPVAVTIHDYQSLCPTVKLYDAEDRVCLRPDPGAMCAVCCRDAPLDTSAELTRTLVYVGRRLRESSGVLDAVLARPRAYQLATGVMRALEYSARIPDWRRSTNGNPVTTPPRASARAYQRRREVNLERLNRVSALVASSKRSAEIYRQLGVTAAPIELVPINPPHIEHLRPRRRSSVGRPLRFVILNACSSTQKGADLVAAALMRLSQRGVDDRYRVSIFGPVSDHVLPALLSHPSVDLHGDYEIDQLDELLEPGDVGLLPSVWEEVYGYVGLEYLAKGIPVIGNAIGAIPDYVRPSQTGWLNHSRTADELSELMISVIEHPEQVKQLSAMAVNLRNELIEPFESGLKRLTGLYRELRTMAVAAAAARDPARIPQMTAGV
jgi:glycosyltransferase involved in cell wall biosynthesis